MSYALLSEKDAADSRASIDPLRSCLSSTWNSQKKKEHLVLSHNIVANHCVNLHNEPKLGNPASASGMLEALVYPMMPIASGHPTCDMDVYEGLQTVVQAWEVRNKERDFSLDPS
eukprot:1076112-Amphidinium_carterae.1